MKRKLSYWDKDIVYCVSALNSQRGGRRAMGLIDEVREECVWNVIFILLLIKVLDSNMLVRQQILSEEKKNI